MTKRKSRPKTPEQLADEHWMWIEGVVLECMRLTMKLSKDFMIHGYKHGKEDERDTGFIRDTRQIKIRIRPTKKIIRSVRCTLTYINQLIF